MDINDEKIFPETAEEWLAAFAPPCYVETLKLLCALPSIQENLRVARLNGTETAYKAGLLAGFHIGGNYVKTGKLEDI